MRILITKEGKIIMNEIEEQDLPNQYKTDRIFYKNRMSPQNNIINKRNFNFIPTQQTFNNKHYRNLTLNNFSITHSTINNSNRIKNNKVKNNNHLNFNEEDEINLKSIKTLKSIKISNKKFNLPKSLTDKYNNNNQKINKNNETENHNKNSILFNDNFPILNTEPNENTKSKIKFYSFREIIPKSTINSIKKQIISDKKLKDKLSKITDENFRSNYEIFTDLEKFNNILDFPILNSNKKSLIKYLNVKKDLNPLNLKNILSCNNEKLNKVNKMCQQLFYIEEKNKLFKEIAGEKIKSKKNESKIEANKKINELKNDINGIKNCLNKYNKQIDKREKYRDRFNDVVKHYWSKYNYDKLNKKGMPKNKYVNESFFDENDTK